MAYDQRQWGSKWPVDEHVPGFRNEALAFMGKCEGVVHKLLECFALGLGMPYEEFRKVGICPHAFAHCICALNHCGVEVQQASGVCQSA